MNSFPVKEVLHLLLKDKTTKKNIIFATDAYSVFGEGYTEKSEITAEKLLAFDSLELQPRVLKSLEAQKLRTKAKAEVMTPGWIVCKMNGYADEEWFGRPDVFEKLEGSVWTPTGGKIEFPEGRDWKAYVDSRRLEITCGEAPYLVSRYDVTTGELIPIERRIGLIDRKLRIVNENAADEDEWLKWAERAFQSSYGYEWQGDNLLIARINLLNTYVDYYIARFGMLPDRKTVRHITGVIVWNVWQMDGLTHTIPYGETEQPKKTDEATDYSEVVGWDDFLPPAAEEETKNYTPVCKIWDWRRENALSFNEIQ